MARSKRIKRGTQHHHQQYHLHATNSKDRIYSVPSVPSESNIASVGSLSTVIAQRHTDTNALHPMVNQDSFSFTANSAPSSVRRGHGDIADQTPPVGSRRIVPALSSLSVHEEQDLQDVECLDLVDADDIQKE